MVQNEIFFEVLLAHFLELNKHFTIKTSVKILGKLVNYLKNRRINIDIVLNAGV